MKPWIIILSSAVVAVAVAAAMTRPELSLATHSGVVKTLMPLLPTLAVTALAVYALCAILLAAGTLVGSFIGLRQHLFRTPPQHGSARPDWIEAFEAYGLPWLAPTAAFPQPQSARADGKVAVQSRFRPEEARREASRSYYIWGARTHFFSAIIVLAAIVALGVAQQHGALPVPAGPIPTIAAALILAGLILIAALARLAVDVAVEPLIDLVSRLPTERVEIALLRRAVEMLDTARAVKPIQADGSPAALSQIPDRLVGVFEEGRRALFDTIERLSATTDGFAVTTRSAIEGLEAAIRDSEAHWRPTAETPLFDTAELSRLQEAVAALTAVLVRMPRWPASDDNLAGNGDNPAPTRREPEPDLAQELKKLLQEIGTLS
jgi:hypothetical protein